MASENGIDGTAPDRKSRLLQQITELEGQILAQAPSDCWAIGGDPDKNAEKAESARANTMDRLDRDK